MIISKFSPFPPPITTSSTALLLNSFRIFWHQLPRFSLGDLGKPPNALDLDDATAAAEQVLVCSSLSQHGSRLFLG